MLINALAALSLSAASAAVIVPSQQQLDYCQKFSQADASLFPKADTKIIVTWIGQATRPDKDTIKDLLDPQSDYEMVKNLDLFKEQVQYAKYPSALTKQACQDLAAAVEESYETLKKNLKDYKSIVPTARPGDFAKKAIVGTDFADILDDRGKRIDTLKKGDKVERIDRVKKFGVHTYRRIRYLDVKGNVALGWIKEDALVSQSNLYPSDMLPNSGTTDVPQHE